MFGFFVFIIEDSLKLYLLSIIILFIMYTSALIIIIVVFIKKIQNNNFVVSKTYKSFVKFMFYILPIVTIPTICICIESLYCNNFLNIGFNNIELKKHLNKNEIDYKNNNSVFKISNSNFVYFSNITDIKCYSSDHLIYLVFSIIILTELIFLNILNSFFHFIFSVKSKNIEHSFNQNYKKCLLLYEFLTSILCVCLSRYILNNYYSYFNDNKHFDEYKINNNDYSKNYDLLIIQLLQGNINLDSNIYNFTKTKDNELIENYKNFYKLYNVNYKLIYSSFYNNYGLILLLFITIILFLSGYILYKNYKTNSFINNKIKLLSLCLLSSIFILNICFFINCLLIMFNNSIHSITIEVLLMLIVINFVSFIFKINYSSFKLNLNIDSFTSNIEALNNILHFKQIVIKAANYSNLSNDERILLNTYMIEHDLTCSDSICHLKTYKNNFIYNNELLIYSVDSQNVLKRSNIVNNLNDISIMDDNSLITNYNSDNNQLNTSNFKGLKNEESENLINVSPERKSLYSNISSNNFNKSINTKEKKITNFMDNIKNRLNIKNNKFKLSNINISELKPENNNELYNKHKNINITKNEKSIRSNINRKSKIDDAIRINKEISNFTRNSNLNNITNKNENIHNNNKYTNSEYCNNISTTKPVINNNYSNNESNQESYNHQYLVFHLDNLFNLIVNKYQDDFYIYFYYCKFLMEVYENYDKCINRLIDLSKKANSITKQYMVYVQLTNVSLLQKEKHLKLGLELNSSKNHDEIANFIINDKLTTKFKSSMNVIRICFFNFWNNYLSGNSHEFSKIKKLGYKYIKSIKDMYIIWNKIEKLNFEKNNSDILYIYGMFLNDILDEKHLGKLYLDKSKSIIADNIFNKNSTVTFSINEILSKGNATCIAIAKDNEGAVITRVSNSFAKLFGYNSCDLEGKNVNTLIPNIFHLMHTSIINRFANEKGTNTRKLIKGYAIHKSGFIMHINTNVTKVPSYNYDNTYLVRIVPVDVNNYKGHIITDRCLNIIYISTEIPKMFNLNEKDISFLKNSYKLDSRYRHNLTDFILELNIVINDFIQFIRKNNNTDNDIVSFSNNLVSVTNNLNDNSIDKYAYSFKKNITKGIDNDSKDLNDNNFIKLLKSIIKSKLSILTKVGSFIPTKCKLVNFNNDKIKNFYESIRNEYITFTKEKNKIDQINYHNKNSNILSKDNNYKKFVNSLKLKNIINNKNSLLRIFEDNNYNYANNNQNTISHNYKNNINSTENSKIKNMYNFINNKTKLSNNSNVNNLIEALINLRPLSFGSNTTNLYQIEITLTKPKLFNNVFNFNDSIKLKNSLRFKFDFEKCNIILDQNINLINNLNRDCSFKTNSIAESGKFISIVNKNTRKSIIVKTDKINNINQNKSKNLEMNKFNDEKLKKNKLTTNNSKNITNYSIYNSAYNKTKDNISKALFYTQIEYNKVFDSVIKISNQIKKDVVLYKLDLKDFKIKKQVEEENIFKINNINNMLEDTILSESEIYDDNNSNNITLINNINYENSIEIKKSEIFSNSSKIKNNQLSFFKIIYLLTLIIHIIVSTIIFIIIYNNQIKKNMILDSVNINNNNMYYALSISDLLLNSVIINDNNLINFDNLFNNNIFNNNNVKLKGYELRDYYLKNIFNIIKNENSNLYTNANILQNRIKVYEDDIYNGYINYISSLTEEDNNSFSLVHNLKDFKYKNNNNLEFILDIKYLKKKSSILDLKSSKNNTNKYMSNEDVYIESLSIIYSEGIGQIYSNTENIYFSYNNYSLNNEIKTFPKLSIYNNNLFFSVYNLLISYVKLNEKISLSFFHIIYYNITTSFFLIFIITFSYILISLLIIFCISLLIKSLGIMNRISTDLINISQRDARYILNSSKNFFKVIKNNENEIDENLNTNFDISININNNANKSKRIQSDKSKIKYFKNKKESSVVVNKLSITLLFLFIFVILLIHNIVVLLIQHNSYIELKKQLDKKFIVNNFIKYMFLSTIDSKIKIFDLYNNILNKEIENNNKININIFNYTNKDFIPFNLDYEYSNYKYIVDNNNKVNTSNNFEYEKNTVIINNIQDIFIECYEKFNEIFKEDEFYSMLINQFAEEKLDNYNIMISNLFKKSKFYITNRLDFDLINTYLTYLNYKNSDYINLNDTNNLEKFFFLNQYVIKKLINSISVVINNNENIFLKQSNLMLITWFVALTIFEIIIYIVTISFSQKYFLKDVI